MTAALTKVVMHSYSIDLFPSPVAEEVPFEVAALSLATLTYLQAFVFRFKT